MKRLFLFVALFAWIGFSASAQVKKETKKEEHKESKMQMDKNKHHFVLKDGKVMEWKDGKSTMMMTETRVGDVWIRPNGEVVMKDNKVVHLKEGQYLDEKGMIHNMDRNMMDHNKMDQNKMNKDKMDKDKMDKEKMDKNKMDKNKMEPPKVVQPI